MLIIDHIDSRRCCSMTMLEKPRWNHGLSHDDTWDMLRLGTITASLQRLDARRHRAFVVWRNRMDCPYCSSMSCTRSLRYGVRDSLRRLVGLFPWECRTCRRRFYWRKRYPDGRPYHTRSVPGNGGRSRWPEGAGPMRNPPTPMNRGASDVPVQPVR